MNIRPLHDRLIVRRLCCADRGQHAIAADQLLGAAPALLGLRPEHVREPELACDVRARLAADRLRAQLREPPGAGGLEARIELRRDRKAEHAVTEEREAVVGVRALLDPARVRKGTPPELLGQLLEQLPERPAPVYAWASDCSRCAAT